MSDLNPLKYLLSRDDEVKSVDSDTIDSEYAYLYDDTLDKYDEVSDD